MIGTVQRTLRLLGPERRWRWLALIALALTVAFFEAIGALLILTLLELVTDRGTPSIPVIGDLSGIFPDVGNDTLLLATAAFVGVFFMIRGVMIVGQAYVQARMIHNAAARLSAHLVRGYLSMPYLFHTQQNSAVLVRNAFDSVSNLTGNVMTPITNVISQSCVVVSLLAVMLWTSPTATLMALALFGPLIWLLMRIVQPRLKRLGRRSQDARTGSIKGVQQALGGVRDIKILGRERFFTQVFARDRLDLARTNYTLSAMGQIPRALIETSLVMIIVILFTTAVLAGDSSEGLLSTLGLFAYAGVRLQPALRDLVKSLNDLKFGVAILDDLSEDRQRVDAALEAERETRNAAPSGTDFSHQIELDNVGFAYTSTAAPAVCGIDLTIRKGEFVGICGPTGGGKSTLVDLVVGLLTPTKGRILVDGHELDDFTFWWQQQLGVVSQSVFLIDDTIRNNIALGRDDVDQGKLQRAIERAQLSQVIADLPDGLDTLVGERGIRLSGGQRQRVAIARAFYREPAVLILDEGTSALDAATEAALVAAIDELKVGRTLIAVAHRISTVQRADRVVVIENGQVAAVGSHDELIDQSHLFRTLAQ